MMLRRSQGFRMEALYRYKVIRYMHLFLGCFSSSRSRNWSCELGAVALIQKAPCSIILRDSSQANRPCLMATNFRNGASCAASNGSVRKNLGASKTKNAADVRLPEKLTPYTPFLLEKILVQDAPLLEISRGFGPMIF